MMLPLTNLTAQERAQAMERFDVLRPILAGQEPLTTMAHRHQLSPRTLQRWLQCYHTDGLAGLGRKRRYRPRPASSGASCAASAH